MSQVSAQKDLAVRVLASIATAGSVAVLVLLPAAVTLTRVEASLLPDDQETIVSFDRTLGGAATPAVALGTAPTSGSVFIAAWRSFDQPSRVRLIKFYAKMIFIQSYLTITAAGVVLGQVALVGPEKLAILAHHIQLMAMPGRQ